MYRLSIDEELGRDIHRDIYEQDKKRAAAMIASWEKWRTFYREHSHKVINQDYEIADRKPFTIYEGNYELRLVGPNTVSVAEYNSDDFDYVVHRYACKLSDIIGV